MGVFNNNLKHYRKRKGLSGREFSELLGIGYSTYMNYENRGNQPPFEILCKMSDILGVTTDILIGHTAQDDYSILKQAGYIVKDNDNDYIEIRSQRTDIYQEPYIYILPSLVVSLICENVKAQQEAFSKNILKSFFNIAQYQESTNITDIIKTNKTVEQVYTQAEYYEALTRLKRVFGKDTQGFDDDIAAMAGIIKESIKADIEATKRKKQTTKVDNISQLELPGQPPERQQ